MPSSPKGSAIKFSLDVASYHYKKQKLNHKKRRDAISLQITLGFLPRVALDHGTRGEGRQRRAGESESKEQEQEKRDEEARTRKREVSQRERERGKGDGVHE